jgi:hypothetical protein
MALRTSSSMSVKWLHRADQRGVISVLDLEPHLGSAPFIGGVGPLAHDPFQTQPAGGLKYLRAVTFEVFDELQSILATQKSFQPALALNEREIAKIDAVKFENVKRQKHRTRAHE